MFLTISVHILIKIFNKLTYYIDFVPDDATPNTLTVDIIKKASKNHKFYIK